MDISDFIKSRLGTLKDEKIAVPTPRQGRIELEENPREAKVYLIDSKTGNRLGEIETPNRLDAEYRARIKNKYKIDALELEGARPKPEPQTIETFVEIQERDARKKVKLCCGATNFKGKRIKIWFDKSL